MLVFAWGFSIATPYPPASTVPKLPGRSPVEQHIRENRRGADVPEAQFEWLDEVPLSDWTGTADRWQYIRCATDEFLARCNIEWSQEAVALFNHWAAKHPTWIYALAWDPLGTADQSFVVGRWPLTKRQRSFGVRS
jgi:hypothetical protein